MTFDGAACIKLVRDRSTGEADLIAAIESLMWHPTQESCDVLFDVVMDKSRGDFVREEAAGSLGTLWIEMGVDLDRIKMIPKEYIAELTADFSLAGIDYDPEG